MRRYNSHNIVSNMRFTLKRIGVDLLLIHVLWHPSTVTASGRITTTRKGDTRHFNLPTGKAGSDIAIPSHMVPSPNGLRLLQYRKLETMMFVCVFLAAHKLHGGRNTD